MGIQKLDKSSFKPYNFIREKPFGGIETYD